MVYIPLAMRPGRPVSTQGGTSQSLEDIKRGIAYVETRGAPNAYSIKGKPRKDGKRAYGKYQVFETNIPSWTKEVTGQALTPEQFLASPDVQEKVADHFLGADLKKYGNASDVASAWFTGRPVADAHNAADYTGTSNNEYQQLFFKGMNGSNSPALAGGAAIPGTHYIPLAMRTGRMGTPMA